MESLSISDELLEILACPSCKSDLELCKDKDALRCVKCKREYPIVDGIPNLILEDD